MVREEPATELTVATRILAGAGVLPEDGRATLRTGEVLYVAARGVSNHRMTPYDVAIVHIADGDALWGDPPPDLACHLARYRADRTVASVIATPSGLVEGDSLHGCAVRALAGGDVPDDAIAGTWRRLVAEARATGTLIGAFPAGQEGV